MNELTERFEVTPPDKPVVTSVTDDTGSSTSDLVTQDDKPVIAGTAEAGSTVIMKLGSTEIATTIQQVARGTAQQSESVNRTATSVDQMNRAIEDVARGAQEQSEHEQDQGRVLERDRVHVLAGVADVEAHVARAAVEVQR